MSFAWSFSRLDGFETCGKRYYELNIAKSCQEDKAEDVGFGTRAHDALKDYLTGKIDDLPTDMVPFRKWADAVKSGPGKLLVEQKFALTRQLEPTLWMASDVWFRGIGDAVRLAGPVGLVVDWKTGRVKENSPQLALMAQCVFSYYPEIQVVRSIFVWLSHKQRTEVLYRRSNMTDVWGDLFQRVGKFETAVAGSNFPPKPGGLCKRNCPVKQCQYWGKGSY